MYDSLFSELQPSSGPVDFDFWKEAEKLGQKAIDYADRNLAASALQIPSVAISSVADKIAQLKASVQDLVRNAEALGPRGSLVAPIDIKINFDEFFEKLSDKTNIILEELKAEFSEPLPEDRSERYTKREEAVDQALDKLCRGLWTLARTRSRGKREVLACQTADALGGPCGWVISNLIELDLIMS